MVNRRITLAARPVGFPNVSDFHLVYSPLPSPAAGEVLVRSVFLSLDPYMRGRMNDADSHARPVAIGEVMVGAAVAFVVESEDAGFSAGDLEKRWRTTMKGYVGAIEDLALRNTDFRQVVPAARYNVIKPEQRKDSLP